MKQSFSFAYSKILIRGIDKVDAELTAIEELTRVDTIDGLSKSVF